VQPNDRLPYVALAIFAAVAVFLNAGVAGKPELIFTLTPLALLVIMSVRRVPLAAVGAAALVLLVAEAVATGMAPRAAPLAPALVAAALLLRGKRLE